MVCLDCQQSHTGPGQNPAWALGLHYTTEVKAHQLHGKQQIGEGCCCYTRLTLIPQTVWNSDTFQWDVPAVSWFSVSSGFSGSRANYFIYPAILSLSCPFCLPDSAWKTYFWSMKMFLKYMLDLSLPCCVWVCTAKLEAVELAAAVCSSSVGKAGAEITFSKCQKDRPSERKCRVKEQESKFASKQ